MKATAAMLDQILIDYFRHLLLEFQLFNMFYLLLEFPKVVVPPQSSHLKHLLEVREPLEYVKNVLVFKTVKLC
jgi:hypothetical protein